MGICCYYLYTTLTHLTEKERELTKEKLAGIDIENVKRFLKYFMMCAPVYVAYMCLVDVPMYYKRWQHDEMNNHQYYTFSEGLSHAASCKVRVREEREMEKRAFRFCFQIFPSSLSIF
jgi:hypothetical protein